MHRTRLGLIASGLCTTTAAAMGPPGPGSAVSFSGGLITIPDSPALTLGTSCTIECWIRPLSNNLNQRFVEQGDGWSCESDRAFDLALNPAYAPTQGHVTAWAFYQPGCTATEAPSAWTLGEWTHVAMTVDTATLKHRLYINGVLANESPHYDASYIARALGDSTRRLALGGAGDWAGHNYIGEMDELRIWSVARTQEEIAGAMSQHLSPTTPGLVSYFKFDEGIGTSTADAKGGMAMGTLQEGVTWVTVPGTPPCNLADIASVGSTPPVVFPDAQLTVDDIIAFINLYSDGSGCPGAAPCSAADVCGVGGPPEPADGNLTVDDVISFVNAYSDGC